MKKVTFFILATTLFFLLSTSQAIGGRLTKCIYKSAGKRMSLILKRDRIRDAAIVAKPLAQNRTVVKYGCNRSKLSKGIKPGEHMTANASGRPLTSENAKKAYGLARKPKYRATVYLDKGTPVKKGKVIGGAPGKGEMVSTKHINKDHVSNVVELH